MKEEKTYLEVPHEGGKITFQYPAFKGYFGDNAHKIDSFGLRRPNSAEIASLVHYLFKDKKRGEVFFPGWEKISDLEDMNIGEYTGNFFLPKSNEEVNNGILLDLDSGKLSFEGRSLVMNKEGLLRRLKEGDSSVKFVPFSKKIYDLNRTLNSSQLKKHPYIVARYGEEGADKLAEVAWKNKNYNPRVSGFNWNPGEHEPILSNLNIKTSSRGNLGIILSWDNDGLGHSFGIVD